MSRYMDGPTINLDKVVEIARTLLPPDTRCCVEQTGGGCATIYVGRSYDVDEYGEPLFREDDCGEYRLVLAGPGAYSWGKGPSWAWPEEFSIGHDQDQKDDPVYDSLVRPMPKSREQRAAEELARKYRAHPFAEPVFQPHSNLWVQRGRNADPLSWDQCEWWGKEVVR